MARITFEGVLEYLTPTTLAAIAADLQEADSHQESGILGPAMAAVHGALVANVGSDEAERLIDAAYPGCNRQEAVCVHGNPWGGECPHCDGKNRRHPKDAPGQFIARR